MSENKLPPEIGNFVEQILISAHRCGQRHDYGAGLVRLQEELNHYVADKLAERERGIIEHINKLLPWDEEFVHDKELEVYGIKKNLTPQEVGEDV